MPLMRSIPRFSYCTNDGSRRNVAVWDACAYDSSLRKRVTTDLKITNQFAQRNGGIVVNYHWMDLLTNPHVEYFHVVLNQQQQKLQLRRFTGLTTVTIHNVTPSDLIVVDDWYRMVVEVRVHPTDSNQAIIAATVTGISDPSWSGLSFVVPTAQYMPADGLFGLGADRSKTRFSYFLIEEF